MALGVSDDTARRYVGTCSNRLFVVPGSAKSGPGSKARVFVTASPHDVAHAPAAMPAVTGAGAPQESGEPSPHRRTASIGAAMRATTRSSAATTDVAQRDGDLTTLAWSVFGDLVDDDEPVPWPVVDQGALADAEAIH